MALAGMCKWLQLFYGLVYPIVSVNCFCLFPAVVPRHLTKIIQRIVTGTARMLGVSMQASCHPICIEMHVPTCYSPTIAMQLDVTLLSVCLSRKSSCYPRNASVR